jgi:lipoate-protein ligase A
VKAIVSVIDTGWDSGARNTAIDRALLERCAAGGAHGWLRWHRYRPTASVGRHQAVDREVRLDYCRAHGIDIVRRPSSGGALYLDGDQLAFSLVLPRLTCDAPLAGLLARTASAVAGGLERLGIRACAKAPNDVEVQGRKIASVFVARRGTAALVQGVVLMNIDVETMLKVLRVPTEKLSADGLAAARERLTAVSVCGGRACGEVKAALLSALAHAFSLSVTDEGRLPAGVPAEGCEEHELGGYARSIDWSDRSRKIEAFARTPGGALHARADFGGDDGRLAGIELASAGHVEPQHVFESLQRALDGVPVGQIAVRVAACLPGHAIDSVGMSAADIVRLLERLADKRGFARAGGIGLPRANALMPYGGAAGDDTAAVLARAGIMLVPYCAKPAWCTWRHRDGCVECGLCEVGDAYALARERGMQVTSITNYEHLVATLAQMKASRVEAYVGMCCSHFFLKRYRAFEDAGMPALLMDISGSNCYELHQEALAYAGAFEAEAKLDGELMAQVMRVVPRRKSGSE